MGFVPKRASNETLFEALHMVMSGGIYVPPMNIGAENGFTHADTASDLDVVSREAADSEFQKQPSLASLGLTPRQTDVLALLLQGNPNKLIARELGLSVETVKDHVAAVLRALGVSSRTQAVLAVSQMSQKHGGFSTRRSGTLR
jgi:DNA-binding NarL/FixJ family response regulator